jgi:capsular polysaccharide biosynthesis protein
MDRVATAPWQRRPSLPTVAGYVALVWSQIAVVAVTTVLGALVGVVLAVRQPPVYSASTAVELLAVPTWVSFDPAADPPPGTTIDTTAQLVRSTPVVDRVAHATALTTAQVTDGLGVSAYPLSRVLVMSFRARTPALAVAGADEAAAALIDQRRAVLEGDQVTLAARLDTALNRLLPKADLSAGRYNPVSRRLASEAALVDSIRAQAATDQARILRYAAPARSVRPKGEVQIVTGAMLGFLAAVAYAWWISGRRAAARS